MKVNRKRKRVPLSARLPSDLLERADKICQEKGIPRSELIEKGLALIVGREQLSQEERLYLATQAMREGRPIPLAVNWERLEKKIGETRPRFETLEEAMAQVRGRR